jgi:predicted enzyme related to lactoylglutathione lyase
MQIVENELILYVSDQDAASEFYAKLLGMEPELYAPGMTEFRLADNLKLGLMPNKGIAKILGDKTPDPSSGNGVPRCELYLTVLDAAAATEHAIECGAKMISALQDRDWGDKVAYFADMDGHIIALAEKIS